MPGAVEPVSGVGVLLPKRGIPQTQAIFGKDDNRFQPVAYDTISSAMKLRLNLTSGSPH
jgi:hypothetical protein